VAEEVLASQVQQLARPRHGVVVHDRHQPRQLVAHVQRQPCARVPSVRVACAVCGVCGGACAARVARLARGVVVKSARTDPT
jgi:hypothetical protein